MKSAASFETLKQIRFHHCDPAGIVFYPQYFVLMNELVEDWFNHGLGVDFARFHTEEKRGIPMAHIECDFIAPSRIGETLTFQLWVEKIGDSSLRLTVEARAGNESRVRATLVVVHASLDTRRAMPFPAEFRERLARFVR